MKKSFLLISICCFLCTCTNKEHSNTVAIGIPLSTEQTLLEIEEEFKESDYDFEDAFMAFEEGDYEGAIVYLRLSIENLREESKNLDTVGKNKVAASIKQLEVLQEALKIAASEEENIEEADNLADSLAIAFATTEMTIAHNYLLFARMYFLNEPAQAQDYLATAIEKMENTASQMEDDANIEAIAIIEISKDLLNKPETSAKETLVTLEEQIHKVAQWLRAHHLE